MNRRLTSPVSESNRATGDCSQKREGAACHKGAKSRRPHKERLGGTSCPGALVARSLPDTPGWCPNFGTASSSERSYLEARSSRRSLPLAVPKLGHHPLRLSLALHCVGRRSL